MTYKERLLVQSFYNQRHERTVSKDILNLLECERITKINRSVPNNKDYKAGLRSEERFFNRIVSKRGFEEIEFLTT